MSHKIARCLVPPCHRLDDDKFNNGSKQHRHEMGNDEQTRSSGLVSSSNDRMKIKLGSMNHYARQTDLTINAGKAKLTRLNASSNHTITIKMKDVDDVETLIYALVQLSIQQRHQKKNLS